MSGDADNPVHGASEVVGRDALELYGFDIVSAPPLLLLGTDGNAIPAIQLRIQGESERVLIDHLTPFPDAVFLSIALLSSLTQTIQRSTAVANGKALRKIISAYTPLLEQLQDKAAILQAAADELSAQNEPAGTSPKKVAVAKKRRS